MGVKVCSGAFHGDVRGIVTVAGWPATGEAMVEKPKSHTCAVSKPSLSKTRTFSGLMSPWITSKLVSMPPGAVVLV